MATHIMTIDDSPEILDMLEAILTEEGYEVSRYLAPDLAVANLGERRPDLIILDWLFGSEERGMQMLQRLKLHPSTARIPVLVCTASVQQVREIHDYLEAKGVIVIFKPFAVDELLSAITAALGARSTRETRASDSAFVDRLGRLMGSTTPRLGRG